MKTREQAIVLADAMVAVGREMGVEVSTELNAMDEPLGHAVGNALEVIESIEIMQGRGPKDLLALVLSQAEKITKVPQDQLLAKIQSGQVLEKFETIVSRQGGDPRQLFSLADVHRASVIREVRSEAAGTVTAFDAGMVGQSALELGAGRSRSSDPVDFAVGFDQLIKTDVYIERGDLIARIHAQSESAADRAEQQLRQALVLE